MGALRMQSGVPLLPTPYPTSRLPLRTVPVPPCPLVARIVASSFILPYTAPSKPRASAHGVCPAVSDVPPPVPPPAAGWLVLATTLVGLAAARLLTGQGRLTPLASWLLHSLYAAKASMLVIPEAQLVLPAALLLAATIAPYFFHGSSWLHNTPAGAAGAGALLAVASVPAGPPGSPVPPASAPSRPRRLRLAPWQGLAHVLSVAVCVALARFAVFDVVQFLISARPTEGLLLGCLALTLAGCLVPLVTHCYAGQGVLARWAVGLALIGMLLVLMEPPLPLAGGARCPPMPLSLSLCPRLWDERHVPMHSAEDVEIWGRGLSRRCAAACSACTYAWVPGSLHSGNTVCMVQDELFRLMPPTACLAWVADREHWPRWLLIAAVVAGMATTGGGNPGAMVPQRSPSRAGVSGRLAFGAVAGLLVGGYTALELLPDQIPLQVSEGSGWRAVG